MLGQIKNVERRMTQVEKREGAFMNMDDSHERKLGRLTEVGKRYALSLKKRTPQSNSNLCRPLTTENMPCKAG